MNLTFALSDGPHVLTEPEPITIATHHPDKEGNYGRVEYTARNVVRRATPEEVIAWRFGEAYKILDSRTSRKPA